MNTGDGNYIGYLLATTHTLDIFSTSKSAASKKCTPGKIINNYCYPRHKLAKNTEGVGGKKIGDWFEPGLIIHKALSPTPTPIFLFPPLQLSSEKENNYS